MVGGVVGSSGSGWALSGMVSVPPFLTWAELVVVVGPPPPQATSSRSDPRQRAIVLSTALSSSVRDDTPNAPLPGRPAQEDVPNVRSSKQGAGPVRHPDLSGYHDAGPVGDRERLASVLLDQQDGDVAAGKPGDMLAQQLVREL